MGDGRKNLLRRRMVFFNLLFLFACNPFEESFSDRVGLSDSSASGGLHSKTSRDEFFQFLERSQSITAVNGNKNGNHPVCNAQERQSDRLCPEETRVEYKGVAYSCRLQKYNLVRSPEVFAVVNPDADALWPGALVQGRPLLSGILSPVPFFARRAGVVSLTLAASSQAPFFTRVSRPSLSETTDAIRIILTQNTNIATPAKFSLNMHRLHSSEQLKVSMGFQLSTPFNFGFDAALNQEVSAGRNRVLVDFTQEYYTIAFYPESGFRGFFEKGSDTSELLNFVSERNPLAYISSVTWGRRLWLLVESNAGYEDLEAALRVRFQGGGVGIGAHVRSKHKKILNEASVQVWVLGGNANDALESLNQDDDQGFSMPDLQRLLVNGANFSQENPGLPVSYAVRHVKDSSRIHPMLNTEYKVRECHPVPDIKNPRVRRLEISLQSLEIEEENGFCEVVEKTGEFRVCLSFRQDQSEGAQLPVFCNGEIRKARPGDVLDYGMANHRLLSDVIQRPGASFSVEGVVEEVDGKRGDTILSFQTSYHFNQNYQWDNWEEQVRVSGSRDGCRATLTFGLKWNDD